MANRGGKVEVVTDFLFLGSKITADSDCSHETIRLLLLERKKSYDIFKKQIKSMSKSRGITLLTKVRLVKAMVFLVVIHGCEC